jgi:hypothetical protein
MFLGGRTRPVHKADNLTVICEPTVYTVWERYRPPQPVMGIALLYSDAE